MTDFISDRTVSFLLPLMLPNRILPVAGKTRPKCLVLHFVTALLGTYTVFWRVDCLCLVDKTCHCIRMDLATLSLRDNFQALRHSTQDCNSITARSQRQESTTTSACHNTWCQQYQQRNKSTQPQASTPLRRRNAFSVGQPHRQHLRRHHKQHPRPHPRPHLNCRRTFHSSLPVSDCKRHSHNKTAIADQCGASPLKRKRRNTW